MSKLLTITDIYNKFAFEWIFVRDHIQWQSPVHLLLGDIYLYETGDHYANRLSQEIFEKRVTTMHQAAMQRVPYTVSYDLQVQGNKIAKIQEQGRVFFNAEGQMLLCRGYIRSQSVVEREGDDPVLQMPIIKELSEFLEKGDPEGFRAAFMYFCVDRLPLIGIRFGYEAVKHLMAQVQEVLIRMVRSSDTVGQITGSSFGIILRNCDHNEIIVVAKRLVEVLEHTPFEIDGQRLLITASIGGAVLQQSQVSADDILRHSERALLDAQHIKKVAVSPATVAKQMAASLATNPRKRRGTDRKQDATNQ